MSDKNWMLQEAIDILRNNGAYSLAVYVTDLAADSARVAELEADRDTWRRVSERLEGEKAALAKREAVAVPDVTDEMVKAFVDEVAVSQTGKLYRLKEGLRAAMLAASQQEKKP